MPAMWKFWIVSLIAVAACAGVLTREIRDGVIPGFLKNANEEMVADWKAGLLLRHKETGTWPEWTDGKLFSEQIYILVGPDGRRIPGGYMHGRQSSYNPDSGHVLDVFKNPMKITFQGDDCHVASAGPDGAWGTADDVTSDNVKERYFDETVDEARNRVLEKMARKK